MILKTICFLRSFFQDVGGPGTLKTVAIAPLGIQSSIPEFLYHVIYFIGAS